MWKQRITVIALAIPFLSGNTPVNGQEMPDSASFVPLRRQVPDVWPSFTIPAVREDWFDFKAEVDADKGLLTRIAPGARQQLVDNGINAFGWYILRNPQKPCWNVLIAGRLTTC